MFIKKMMSAAIISLILVLIEISINLAVIFYLEGGFFNLFGLLFVIPTYIVIIFLYGVPSSILIEFITRKLKNKKAFSLCLYIIFSAVFLPIYFIINPFGTNLAFIEFLKGSQYLLYVSIFYSILFWYIDLKIERIRCNYHKKVASLIKED